MASERQQVLVGVLETVRIVVGVTGNFETLVAVEIVFGWEFLWSSSRKSCRCGERCFLNFFD